MQSQKLQQKKIYTVDPRELFDYTPASSVGGRITPTYGLVGSSSSARKPTSDYSRSSRERSLGRDNDFNDRTTTSRSLGSGRRSESLTRGGASLSSPSTSLTTATTTTSRPSLSTQGRSLTQNEFVRTSPRGSVSGRISAGLDEDSRIRLSDRGSSGYGGGSSSLNDRGRSDWRRVSVPERGKDYSSLQSKYKR